MPVPSIMNMPHFHGSPERISRSPSASRRVTIRIRRHGDVGGGVGEHAGRVGDRDATRAVHAGTSMLL